MSLDVEFNIIRIRLDSQMCFMSLGKNLIDKIKNLPFIPFHTEKFKQNDIFS